MTTALLLFASTFVAVLALVLQSLNVNGGHRVLACITSLFIGAGNLVLFKTLPGSTDALQVAGYLLGGPVAVLVGMWAHPHLVLRLQRLRQARPKHSWWMPLDGDVERRIHFPTPSTSWGRFVAPDWRSVPIVDRAADDTEVRRFARRLLDPDDLGHLASAEIRAAARTALGLRPAEPRP